VFEDAGSDSDDADDVSGSPVAKLNPDMADIMYKYCRAHWRDIRKESGVHQRLFLAEEEGEGLDEMFDPEGEGEKPEEDEDEEVDIDAV
jgi:hypothetical protein